MSQRVLLVAVIVAVLVGAAMSLAGATGSVALDGSDGDDRLRGGPGIDQIRGYAGDDHLYGGGAPDGLFGNGDDDSVVSAMRAGARGYVLKSASPSEVLEILRSVAGGEARFGPEIAHRLTGFLLPPAADPSEAFPGLTAREREILDYSPRPRQRRDLRAALPEPQHRAQPHLPRLRQARRRKPGPGHRPRPRGGDGRPGNVGPRRGKGAPVPKARAPKIRTIAMP